VLLDVLGFPVRPEAYSDRFAGLCREEGVPVVRLHSARHTIALMLHRAGAGSGGRGGAARALGCRVSDECSP